MIGGGMRASLLLGVSTMALVAGCDWLGGSTSVSSKQARPGAERSVTLSAGLPSASGSSQYDSSVAPADETSSGPQVGSTVAAKGGQKAQQETLAKEAAEGDRKARAEADRAAAARKEADAAAAAASPPKSSPASSQPTSQVAAPLPAAVTATPMPPPSETTTRTLPAAPAPDVMVASPPVTTQPIIAPTPAPAPVVAVVPAPARPADPNKAFEPPPGWTPPTSTANPPPPPPESVAPRPAPTLATVSFMPQSVQIYGAARTELDRVAQSAKGMRAVQLRAYASGSDPAEARKVALARALSVRTYLIDRGMRPRIEIGACDSSDSGPRSDRVDVLGP
jgi:hypothetical protein